MNTKWSLVLLLAANTTFADSLVTKDNQLPLNSDGIAVGSSELNSCEHQARQYGNGRDFAHVDPVCFKAYLKLAAPNAIRRTDDGSLFAFASNNMLVLQRPLSTEVLAGSNVPLTHPKAIAIDTLNKEIAVLDGDKTLMVFRSLRGGNVAPLRSFSGPQLAGATSLAIDTLDNEIWVGYENGSITAFSRLADVEGRKPEGTTRPLRTLSSGVTTIPANSVIAINTETKELFALDKDGKRILIFDLPSLRFGSSKVAPKGVIAGNDTGLDSPEAISYSNKENRIEVLQKSQNGSYTGLVFNRTQPALPTRSIASTPESAPETPAQSK